MDLKLTLSPVLGITVHPALALKKTAGKEWEAGGIKNKSQLVEWKKNKTDLLVAVGELRANGSDKGRCRRRRQCHRLEDQPVGQRQPVTAGGARRPLPGLLSAGTGRRAGRAPRRSSPAR